MSIARINVAWQNWPGAPGVTTFYADDTVALQPVVDAIRSMFNALAALLPTGLTIQVPSTGDRIDEANGNIIGSWTVATPPAVVTATGAGAYAGNAGAVMHWLTAGVVNGRRVRGRSFIVPLVGSQYDASGSIAATPLSTLQTAAAGLITAAGANLRVWHRNTAFTSGSAHAMTGSRVPDLAVSLRSRRI